MPRFTLDMNCIIDLQVKQPDAPYIRRLMQANQEKRIRLQVVAIDVSELEPDGTYALNFRYFQQRIADIGLSDVEILRPLLYFTGGYWNYSVWVGEEATRPEREIHSILFPQIELEYREYCKRCGLDLNAEWTRECHSEEYHIQLSCISTLSWDTMAFRLTA